MSNGLLEKTEFQQAMALSRGSGWLERRYVQRASLCGPYFYYRYRDEQGKLCSIYFGKSDPLSGQDATQWRGFFLETTGVQEWDDKEPPAKAARIYLIKMLSNPPYYKIGLSETPLQRLSSLQCGIPFDLQIVHSFPADHAKAAEEILHIDFASKRVRGEWFALDEDDVAWLCSVEGYDDGTFHANY